MLCVLVCTLAYQLLLLCEINGHLSVSGRDVTSFISGVCLAWKSTSKEVIPHYLCRVSQKAQTGELELFCPFSLPSLTVRWENCGLLLWWLAAVAANTNETIHILQVQFELMDVNFLTGLPVPFRNVKR